MSEQTSKPHAARCWVVLGALILAGVLAIHLQQQSPARATGIPAPTEDAGSQRNAPAGNRPIAVIYELNPWAEVIGSDSPSFALYEDGLMIFVRPKAEGGGLEYASAKLSGQELDSLVRSLPAKQFQELESHYETTMLTDQPSITIRLWDGDRVKRVHVYGGLKRTDNDRKQGAPAAFVEVYEKLTGSRPSNATRWIPEKVELMIWPYDNAGEVLPWPKGWPDTKHPETKKRGGAPSQIYYSIYLSWKQYQTLKEMARARSLNAVFINNRKWAFAFRFPLPGEDTWRKNLG